MMEECIECIELNEKDVDKLSLSMPGNGLP